MLSDLEVYIPVIILLCLLIVIYCIVYKKINLDCDLNHYFLVINFSLDKLTLG